MKAAQTLLVLTPSAIHTLGWTLLHSLWQGILIAILLNGAMSLLQKSRASTRYLFACIALVLMLVLPLWTSWTSNLGAPVATAAYTDHKAASSGAALTDTGTPDPSNALNTDEPIRQPGQLIETLLPWLTTAWFLGVVLQSLRLLAAWAHTQRLKRSQARLILEYWQRRVQRLSRQLRVTRPVLLLESSLVRVPTVIGWLRPALLLPTSVFTGLTPGQLDMIVAHELAHIRRHDYLVNVLQTIVDTLLFYHPAVRWVSRRIRVEREHVCDDIAVAFSGDALVYARALTRMERLRKDSPDFAMAADGASLVTRVCRLVSVEAPPSHRRAGLLSSIALLSALAAVIATGRTSQHSFARTFLRSDRRERADANASRLQMSRSSHSKDRALAICSLGRSGAPGAVPLLVHALGDDAAIPVPVGCWDSGSWSPALRVLHHSSPAEEAAMALAAMGSPSLDSLVSALRHANPTVRRNAAWAIGEMRGGDGVERSAALDPLILALTDSDASVRRAAALALGELKDPRAAAPLIGGLSDDNAGAREMAAWALGETKAHSALEALALARSDPTERVRRMARWALAEIEGGSSAGTRLVGPWPDPLRAGV
jgi:beta-lactamase regulating signal transducer with metallopeptidase domain